MHLQTLAHKHTQTYAQSYLTPVSHPSHIHSPNSHFISSTLAQLFSHIRLRFLLATLPSQASPPPISRDVPKTDLPVFRYVRRVARTASCIHRGAARRLCEWEMHARQQHVCTSHSRHKLWSRELIGFDLKCALLCVRRCCCSAAFVCAIFRTDRTIYCVGVCVCLRCGANYTCSTRE